MNRPNPLALDDVNGVVFQEGIQGYQEEADENLICYVPAAADEPAGLTYPIKAWLNGNVAANQAAYNAYLNDVYLLNYIHLFNNCPDYAGHADYCAKVAYIRMLLVREGQANPDILPGTKNCDYNLCRRAAYRVNEVAITNYRAVVDTEIARVNAIIAAGVALVIPAAHVDNYANNIALFGAPGNAAGLPAPVWYTPLFPTIHEKAKIRKQLADLICIVAYFFRVRAHHWQPDFDARYAQVWQATAFSDDQPTIGVPWKNVARDAMKVIFPQDMDDFWGDCVAHTKCSGNLAIKYEAPCAGTAAIVACDRGADDLIAAFPMFRVNFQDKLAELAAIKTTVLATRWGGSINHRFYGVPKVTYREAPLSSLAAVILAALAEFDDTAPLSKSKALQRVGSGAPIVGAVTARVLGKVAESNAMIAAYMP